MNLPKELIKVFTKYDQVYDTVMVPSLCPLVAQIVDDIDLLEEADMPLFDYIPFIRSETEQGLEGVIYQHYKRANG